MRTPVPSSLPEDYVMSRNSVAVGLIVLALLGLAVAAPADAQQITTLYYQELEREGRVYVFNTPEAWKAFQASGEMGKSITLVGLGVDGATLIAENETAVDLYLFKHGLPATCTRLRPPTIRRSKSPGRTARPR